MSSFRSSRSLPEIHSTELNRKFLLVVVPVLSALAIFRLTFEFHRLLYDPGSHGAVDLRLIYQMVHRSFAGEPLTVAYPPASAVLLWPFVGWVSWPVARWLWGATLLLSLICVIASFARTIPRQSPIHRMVGSLYVLAIYPTAIVIGNGQLAIHLMAALFSALFLLHRENRTWRTDILVVLLLLFTLVKPNFSVPFFLLVLIVDRAWRIVFTVGFLYIAITFAIVSMQNREFFEVLSNWSSRALAIDDGYGHVHLLFFRFGVPEWSSLFSFALLGFLAIWLYCYRKADRWILLGVTAILARIWTYHRLFDDLLILFPIIALIRIVQKRNAPHGKDKIAGILLLLVCLSLLQPGTLLTMAASWGTVFRSGQVLLWMTVAVFLCWSAVRAVRVEGVTAQGLQPNPIR